LRVAAVTLAGIALAACEAAPVPAPAPVIEPVAPERVEAFAIAARQVGCTVDPVRHEALHRAGFTDAEMDRLGAELVAEGRARRTVDGVLVIVTEDCV
jgi:hypothetical protein